MAFCFCVLMSGAQNLTATYVALADSADYYIDRKMWPQAENVIIKALKHEPANKSNYLLWSNLGLVREQRENYEGAVEAYTIGLSSAPKSTVLLTNRARAYMAQGINDSALADLDKALEVDSLLQWPLKMRGIILTSKGRIEDALKDLLKFEELNDKDADVKEVIGDIYSLKPEPDKAVEFYRSAYKISPSAELVTKMALVEYSLGNIEVVADDISNGIKDFPQAPELYLMRALLNKSRYQTDAYESDLKTAKNLGINQNLYNSLIKSQ